MARETRLTADMLIQPLFIHAKLGSRTGIASMPGQFRWSIDSLPQAVEDLSRTGIRAVILFGLPASKDDLGSGAYDPEGIVQEAVRAIKATDPKMTVITDTCLDEYTVHGHCGIVVDGRVDNDVSLDYLSRIAVSHAQAGADMVAPSDMMDGRVQAIRSALDGSGFKDIPIMSYAAKYASAFYGPF
ncbi:MAG: hypothetical protein NVSMB52_00970 [Chloroflexota bacterium]